MDGEKRVKMENATVDMHKSKMEGKNKNCRTRYMKSSQDRQ